MCLSFSSPSFCATMPPKSTSKQVKNPLDIFSTFGALSFSFSPDIMFFFLLLSDSQLKGNYIKKNPLLGQPPTHFIFGTPTGSLRPLLITSPLSYSERFWFFLSCDKRKEKKSLLFIIISSEYVKVKSHWRIQTFRLFSLSSSFLLSFIPKMKRPLSECCVCAESLCDPMRTLPCLHSACLECLDKLIQHSTFLLHSLIYRSNSDDYNFE